MVSVKKFFRNSKSLKSLDVDNLLHKCETAPTAAFKEKYKKLKIKKKILKLLSIGEIIRKQYSNEDRVIYDHMKNISMSLRNGKNLVNYTTLL